MRDIHVERRLVVEGRHYCPRAADGPWKREPCAASEAADEFSVVKRQIVYQVHYTCGAAGEGLDKRCLPEEKEAASKDKRQIVYQVHYTCGAAGEGIDKRCLPEETEADSKEKRQIVYQVHYTCGAAGEGLDKRCLPEEKEADSMMKRQTQTYYHCARAAGDVWKREPCGSAEAADAAIPMEKRLAEAAAAAELKIREWSEEMA